MGYELHITRATDHIDSAAYPIARSEWNAYAGSHPSLTEDGWIEWTGIGREPVYTGTDAYGETFSLTWYEYGIDVNGLEGDDYSVILAICDDLRAHLVGDEGEHYTIDGPEQPR
jgi:hypothetical protein